MKFDKDTYQRLKLQVTSAYTERDHDKFDAHLSKLDTILRGFNITLSQLDKESPSYEVLKSDLGYFSIGCMATEVMDGESVVVDGRNVDLKLQFDIGYRENRCRVGIRVYEDSPGADIKIINAREWTSGKHITDYHFIDTVAANVSVEPFEKLHFRILTSKHKPNAAPYEQICAFGIDGTFEDDIAHVLARGVGHLTKVDEMCAAYFQQKETQTLELMKNFGYNPR